MAITQNTYTGNGSTRLFSLTFPYLDVADIKVSLNGTITTAYTLANATTIQFNSAPASGVAIRIFRETDDTDVTATFFPGSAIRSEDLNRNFDQILYVSQESNYTAEQALSTINTANANSVNALNVANTKGDQAIATANSASSVAAGAVSTANAANTASANAVGVASAANTNSTNAVTTANAAASSAATALSTANTAASNASAAVSTANTAASNASAAVSTANTASTNASNAVTTATTASTNASNALTAANNAVTEANDATAYGIAANANALEAVAVANAAASAVASSVQYDTVANVASIPATPSNGDAIEITNSTGVESFSPLAGLPGGFVGNPGLSVRIIYNTAGVTWSWIQYYPNDPENRYLTTEGGTMTGPLLGDDSTSASTPAFAFDGDANTGVGRTGSDELALVTGGVARLTADAAGNVNVPGGLSKGGNSVVTTGDTGTITSTMIADGTIANADISPTAAIVNSKLAPSGVTAATYGSSTQIPSLTINDKGVVTAATTNSLPAGIVTTSDTGSVTSTMIAPATIVDGDISTTASIAHSKLASITAGRVLVGNASNVPTATAVSGDASLSSGGVVTLANSGVTAGTYRSVTVDAKGRTTAGTNPTTFAGYGISDTSASLAAAISDNTGSGAVVFASSPALIGTPTAPTASVGTNTTQIATTAFVIANLPQSFPDGTVMLFAQTNAPTGWTKSTAHNNKALRVVSGTASSGGTTAFTSVFASRTPAGAVSGTVANTTLAATQIPSHTHGYTTRANLFAYGGGANQNANVGDAGATTGAAGGGGAHSHGFTGSFTGTAMDFAVQYVDVIIATKA